MSDTITNAKCFSNAITFTAATRENGFSGVQQFKQTAQDQELFGGRWVNITNKLVRFSQRFPNDGRNFFYALNWQFTSPTRPTGRRTGSTGRAHT